MPGSQNDRPIKLWIRSSLDSSTGPGVSRRDFVKRAAAGAGGLASRAGMSSAFARASDVIRIGFVSPSTGPLGGFGEGDPYVLDVARKALANGLTVGGKKYKVEIIDQRLTVGPGARQPIGQGV